MRDEGMSSFVIRIRFVKLIWDIKPGRVDQWVGFSNLSE